MPRKMISTTGLALAVVVLLTGCSSQAANSSSANTTSASANGLMFKSNSVVVSGPNPFKNISASWVSTTGNLLNSVYDNWIQFVPAQTQWFNGNNSANPVNPLHDLQMSAAKAMHQLPAAPSGATQLYNNLHQLLGAISQESGQLISDMLGFRSGGPIKDTSAGKKISAKLSQLANNIETLQKYRVQIQKLGLN